MLVHRSTILALALACAGAALSLPRAARAADTAEANRHFQLGVELYAEGKFEEALIEFERAYEIAPHPLVLYNMAGTHRELSHYDEAIQNYESFLKEGEGKVSPELLERGKSELTALRARVGSIDVIVDREGATVTVDGRKVGDTPLGRPLVLGPGRRTIQVGMPGGRVETRVVTLAAGDHSKVEITLGPDRGGGGGELGDDPGGLRKPVVRGGRLAVSAAVGTNALLIGDTGTAVVGVGIRAGSRITLGIDLVTVAWSLVPSVRLRLFGEALSLHAIAAAPISFTDGDESATFVAGALGLGARWFATPSLAVRAEALVSVAGDAHGTALPAFVGVELWF